MINKIAKTIEMSFNISSSEQKEAQEALNLLEETTNAATHALDHLDIIYNPFKKAQDLSPEAVYEYRGAINRFKDQIKENYNKVINFAFQALIKLNLFNSDTHVMELINAFKDAIGDLESKVSDLMEDLDDHRNPDFKNIIIADIDLIKKQTEEIKTLIQERIEDFMNVNILSKDWTSSVSEDIRSSVKETVPYITQLFKERQKALEGLE